VSDLASEKETKDKYPYLGKQVVSQMIEESAGKYHVHFNKIFTLVN
jgi:hypothetical protein